MEVQQLTEEYLAADQLISACQQCHKKEADHARDEQDHHERQLRRDERVVKLRRTTNCGRETECSISGGSAADLGLCCHWVRRTIRAGMFHGPPLAFETSALISTILPWMGPGEQSEQLYKEEGWLESRDRWVFDSSCRAKGHRHGQRCWRWRRQISGLLESSVKSVLQSLQRTKHA